MAYRFFQRIARISQWYEARYTALGRLLGGLTFAAAVFATDPTRTRASILLAGLFAVFALASVLNLRWRPALNALRQLPPHAVTGVRVIYRIRLSNGNPASERSLVIRDRLRERFPQPHEMDASSIRTRDLDNWFDRRVGFRRWIRQLHALRGAELAPVSLPMLPAGGHAEIALSFVPLRRGLIEFAKVEIARVDPLGLSYVARGLSLPQQLLVLPRQHSIPNLAADRSGTVTPDQHAAYGVVHGSNEFHTLREYRAGDSLRHVHWRASAKRGAHVVKQFVDGYHETLKLLVDTVADADTFESLIVVVASLVEAATRQATQGVELDWLDTRAGIPSTRAPGARGAQLLLEELALVSRSTTDYFAPAVTQLRLDPAQTILFVTANWQQSRQQFSRHLATSFNRMRTLIVASHPVPITDLNPACVVLRTNHLAEDLHRFSLSSRRA